MPLVQLVVFDMAGTTINEDNLVYKTVQLSLEKAGYTVPLDKVLLLAAGKEKRQAITDVLADLAGQKTAQAAAPAIYESFKTLLATAYSNITASPMPGAETLFRQLRDANIKVALNTGYNRETAESLLRQLNWLNSPLIDLVITASDVTHGRPHPDMIRLAMQQSGISNPDGVAKIGDSITDVEEGRLAGCSVVVGITTGAQTREQLLTAKPTHIVDHLNELPEILLP
jgi:phosphonatase-like hydrolase